MTAPRYFDDLYADNDDPWGLSTRAYESRKYALSLAALPRERYARAFEPGCAIGVLTEALAPRCDALLATDGAPRAVEQARVRLAPYDHVEVQGARVPQDWPEGTFDLLVVSELLYFLDDGDREEVARRAAGSLEPGGHLLAVHWRHPFDEAPTDGDRVHAELRNCLTADGCRRVVHHVEDDFRLDVYERG